MSADLIQLALAVLAFFLPGTVLLKVGLRRGWWETLAAAPAVTIAICYVAAVVTGLLHVRWGRPAVGIVTLVLTGLAWTVVRRWSRGRSEERTSVGRWQELVPAVGVLVAAAVGVRTFLRGLGHLSVLPQEHDMIQHTLLVSLIQRTGQAAPWLSSPVDLLSGKPGGFYPNGLHMVAAMAATDVSKSVAALNGVTAVLFAVVLPLGMAALARLLAPPAIRPTAGAVAALISVLAYRPTFAYLHDGGALANAAAIAVSAGIVYAFVAAVLERRTLSLVTAAAGLVGASVVHPTAAPTIGITAFVWTATALLAEPDRRAALRRLIGLALAAVAAGCALVPFLLAGSSATSAVAGFPRDMPKSSLSQALGTTLSFSYGGYFDVHAQLAQTVLALISLAGVVLCLYLRVNLPLLATYGIWLAVLLLWLIAPSFPLVSSLGAFYYNSYIRISNAFSLLQWLTAAVAVGYLAVLLARLARVALDRVPRAPAVRGWPAPLASAVAVLVLLGLTYHYAGVNSLTLKQRYAQPEFVRVDGADLAAGRFLAQHVQPGQRVMNSANDGSTYDYVFYGVPLVESSTLGAAQAPYTTELLQHFDDVEQDDRVRSLICDMDIAWVVADSQAPLIGASAKVTNLGTHGLFSTPRGFRHLDEVSALHRAFEQGTVTVYEVDRAGLGCHTSQQ